MSFRPEELLFSPTADCTLNCRHCSVKRSGKRLDKDAAVRFLKGCAKAGVKTVAFTGGEPFLATGFLCALSKAAVKENMLFGRIMTSASRPRGAAQARRVFKRLRDAGYDGDICVSVDAFHGQDLKNTASFIKAASETWGRPDCVSIAYVGGAEEAATRKKLVRLAGMLKGRLSGFGRKHSSIKGKSLFIKVLRIGLSPVGRASRLKDPWRERWFKDDRCKGPGNVFHVLPGGDVKPCCGYASDAHERLTIGNIRRDTVEDIIKNARDNRFVRTVFGPGLGAIRRRLEKKGARFPGKAGDQCYFCDYILEEIPEDVLEKCLD